MPVRLIKGFWVTKLFSAIYELTGIGGLFFFWEEKLKLNQIEITTTSDNEICLFQENVYSDDGGESIYITPEMVDLVCNELKQLKNKIIKNQERE